jgi:hypothetical protein
VNCLFWLLFYPQILLFPAAMQTEKYAAFRNWQQAAKAMPPLLQKKT